MLTNKKVRYQGGASYVDFFVIYVSCRLFIAALWSPAEKGTSWLSCVWCNCVFVSFSHVVSWGTWLYQFLIFAFFLTCDSKAGKYLKVLLNRGYSSVYKADIVCLKYTMPR